MTSTDVPGAVKRTEKSHLFVRLTHHEITTLSPDALLLLCQWRRRFYRDATYHRRSYEEQQEWCGWTADQVLPSSLDRRIGRAVHELEAAGLIKRRKRFLVGLCQSVPSYKVVEKDPEKSGRWEKLPLDILDRIQAAGDDSDLSSARLLKHWLTWRMLCGSSQQTSVPIGHLAAIIGCEARRVTQVRDVLAAHELLFLTSRPGRSHLVSVTAPQPEPAPQNTPQQTTDDSPTEPRGLASGDLGANCLVTAVPDVRSEMEADPSHTSADPSLGPQGRNSQVTREPATADKPPTPTTPHQPTSLNNDAHAWAARRLVNAQPLLATAPTLLRLQIINLLARRSRNATTQGRPFDWRLLIHRIAARFEDADATDDLIGNECTLVRETLAGLRADQLAAAPQPATTAPTAAHELDVLTAPPQPSGPTLEDLAATALPAITDDEALLQVRTIELAKLVHDALVDDPDMAVDSVITRAVTALRGLPGFELVRLYAVRRVERAIEQSIVAAEYQAWLELCETPCDEDIVAQIRDSLTMAAAA